MYAGISLAIFLMLQIPDKPMTLNVEDFSFAINLPIEKTNSMENTINEEEFELLCKCVEAEAGDQGYLGKVYVTDCILNRCDAWGKTITEIIYQKHQFEVVSNNRINKVEVTEETKKAVSDELRSRTRYDILHFRMDYYHSFGTPVFSHKDHYFSK
jgi:spore germination cell wall hydrolase CwlJ-like protein